MSDDQIRVERTLAAWGRIEAWLKEHAPRSYRGLPAPAGEDEIRAVELELDLVLPADVRAFYQVRNGTGPAVDFDWSTGDRPLPDPSGYLLPDGDGIAPLSYLGTWYDHLPVDDEYDDPRRRYLPFMVSDPDGFYGSFVDCTPSSEGYGQIGSYAEAAFPEPGGHPSLAAYLTDVADLLYGKPDEIWGMPGILDGCLHWADPQAPPEGWEPVPQPRTP
ncbi:SMI1/KNR4 family protein [Streptomyces melanogenes]|uniref:SMI1/KNR4 family protein n=1 Tax=Streptomyces melanogenes TaxID=67326 RepID=UPI00167CD7E3|nr:SMI1/KNR4 family protein [Streptomyces melanogenes]GGP75908.1 hypothetical protein GCM10010278_62790 [Streptomyces melanogenes]